MDKEDFSCRNQKSAKFCLLFDPSLTVEFSCEDILGAHLALQHYSCNAFHERIRQARSYIFKLMQKRHCNSSSVNVALDFIALHFDLSM